MISKNPTKLVTLMKKLRVSDELAEYLFNAGEEERAIIVEFFSSLSSRLNLASYYENLIIKDYDRALLYLLERGVSAEEAVSRLDPAKLGGYYCREAKAWYPLDSSAKVYPLSMSRNKMQVFRLSAYMTEPVVPELLQVALNAVVTRFPSFAVSVRRGFFWHYLDGLKARFEIAEENDVPCGGLDISSSRSPAFKVQYYNDRISVEFFHVLTDGTGGMIFLKTLVAEYVRLFGYDIPCTHGVADIREIPDPHEAENAFVEWYKPGPTGGFMGSPAAQMGGRLTRKRPSGVIHFIMDSDRLRSAARSKGVSVTTLMTSLIFVASRASMDSPDGYIQVQVPVDMRRIHPSATLRNFSLYASPRLPAKDIRDVDSILNAVETELKKGTSEEYLNHMLTSAVMLVNAARPIPLSMKGWFIRILYGFLGDKLFTNTLSNLGIIDLPEELRPHVRMMDFVLGTVITNRAACSMVTVNGKAVLTIAKLTNDPSFEERLYYELGRLGVEVEAEGSAKNED